MLLRRGALPHGQPVTREVAPMTHRGEMLDQGYTVARGLLEPAEITALRPSVLAHHGDRRAEPLAVVREPELRWLLSDPRIRGFAREVLDAEPVVTWHFDSSVNAAAHKWHKDSGRRGTEGYFGRSTAEDPTPTVIKLGVFCQDQPHGGLQVRPASHHEPDIEPGTVTIPTRVGDVIAFDVRISHAGDGRWRRRVLNRLDDRAPSVGHLLRRRDRVALFFSFGVGGDLTDHFAVENWTRAKEQAGEEGPIPVSLISEVSPPVVQLV
jgi:hypothetical protein